MNNNRNYTKLFFYVSLVMILLSIAYPFVMKLFFTSWQDRGAVGDSFGILNTIFSGIALAGVIITLLMQKQDLDNQKIEMQLQRDEMVNTRNEFLINRATNLVYNQLDRFERSIVEFKIEYSNHTYLGNDALLFLYRETKRFTFIANGDESQKIQRIKAIILHNLSIYGPNKNNIEDFAQNSYNSVQALKYIINNMSLGKKEQENLKEIFFTNIGFVKMNVLKNILETIDYALEYKNQIIEITLPKHNLSGLMNAEIFITDTINFYDNKI